MDKIKRNQICLIIIGLFLIFIGFYFYSLGIDYIVSSSVSVAGMVLLLSGVKYKERMNRKKLTGDERNAYLRSDHFILGAIGLVIFFIGLGGLVLANYVNDLSKILWIFIIMFVGVLFIFAAWISKAANKKEKIPV